ncbi:peptidyl-prolyl cis-trans isomerase FKBP65-like [Galendromus occidentalis]|uniref:peptidylprolyl isomerase n=1 Tax=Galendromus occidentalis TaxID=34638 RepID=A0AAJ7P9L5_9ACAR|nr:peptidyl-prolyl cis-trans isomerase FKBP65-like [Galendromus occidentalis]
MAKLDKISIETLKGKGEALLPKLLYKLQLAPGAGEDVPENSEVQVELRLIVRGQSIIEYSQEPFVKQLEQVLPTGLKIALSSMRKGERALIWMDSALAFGSSALSLEPGVKIAKDSNLVFEVFLRSWNDKPESTKLRFKDRTPFDSMALIREDLNAAEALIENGKKLQALRILKRSLWSARKVQIDAEKSPAEERARQSFVHAITVKTAECAYELGHYPLAVSLSKEALEVDRFDAYVNYICGCAYFSLGYVSSATRYIRAAHHSDLQNGTYERKMREIERHQALLNKDVDYDSDREEFEEYAAHCLKKIDENKKALRKSIRKFVNEQFEKRQQTVLIGGGFPPALLKEFKDKIMAGGSRIYFVHGGDDVLELKY